MFEDLDLELIKNEIYTQAILNVYEKFNEKEYEKTINKNFTGAHYNSSYIINQKLVESVETLFGIFIEKYIIKFLKQNFKIINLSITQKSDYTILDENSNDLYLCELKTNRKTFNNDSLKSTNSKLENIEKNVLDLKESEECSTEHVTKVFQRRVEQLKEFDRRVNDQLAKLKVIQVEINKRTKSNKQLN